MPIRVVAVVFTTLQSAVLGTNYSSVAVKLLYVIQVFVSERFFKQERNLIHVLLEFYFLALLEDQSDQNSVCITFSFNHHSFVLSSVRV